MEECCLCDTGSGNELEGVEGAAEGGGGAGGEVEEASGACRLLDIPGRCQEEAADGGAKEASSPCIPPLRTTWLPPVARRPLLLGESLFQSRVYSRLS